MIDVKNMFPKLSSELHSLIILCLGFMILDPATSVLKNMQVTIVSSIAYDKPGFTANGYTLRGIIDSVTCISLWFAPYICHTIGARLTVILSSLGYLYYIGSYAIEEEWALYSSAVILGISYGTIVPPKSQYLVEGSHSENVVRNVGICYSLQTVVQILCNIFVFFNFEGKEYINQLTRRKVIFGILGVVAVSVISFAFLPKIITKGRETPSLVKTLKKAWNILITPIMLCMCITLIYFGMQFTFEDGVYSPSIGFTLAFGDSVKELMPLSGISSGVGALLGFVYSVLLGAFLRNRSYARRLLVLSGILGELIAYAITFMNLPDSANLGNTEAKSYLEPNVYLAMLGALLLGFGNACIDAQVYSFVGDNFRENSGEAYALCNFIKFMFISVYFYLCGNVGLHTQVVILSVAAVVGFLGCLFADGVLDCLRNKNPAAKHPEQCS